MAVLCLINASEGVAMNIIWSYVPFLVGQWYDDDELGFFVGLLASSFFVTQCISAVAWGKLSDRIGRRPILLSGVFGSACAMCVFGWSQSYEVCVLGRLLAGALNGNLGIVKSYLGEMTDSTNRARGFSYLSLVWGLTSILAPAAGGFLADPASKWAFFQTPYWEAHPYLLPSLVSILVSSSGATIGFFFLPESPKWLKHKQKAQNPESVEVDQGKPQDPTSPQSATSPSSANEQIKNGKKGEEIRLLGGGASVRTCCSCCPYDSCWRKCWSPTLHACLCYSFLAFTMTQFDELIPLMGEEMPERGGLGFDTSQIGILLSIGGAVLLFYQGFLFNLLARRIGANKGYSYGIFFAGCVIASFPTVAIIRRAAVRDPDAEWGFWVYYGCLIFLQKVGGSTAFTFSMILVNDYTPPGKLGTTNGIAHSLGAFGRVFSPTLAGGVWAASMQIHWLAPYGPFIPYLMVMTSCFGCSIFGCLLPRQETLGFEVL